MVPTDSEETVLVAEFSDRQEIGSVQGDDQGQPITIVDSVVLARGHHASQLIVGPTAES